jgi:hypothetical protein
MYNFRYYSINYVAVIPTLLDEGDESYYYYYYFLHRWSYCYAGILLFDTRKPYYKCSRIKTSSVVNLDCFPSQPILSKRQLCVT